MKKPTKKEFAEFRARHGLTRHELHSIFPNLKIRTVDDWITRGCPAAAYFILRMMYEKNI